MEEQVAALRKARAALSSFDGLLDSSADAETLIDAYLDTRRALASAFMSIAVGAVRGDGSAIKETRRRVAELLRIRYGDSLPASLLVVRPYSRTHGALLAYMQLHVGGAVRGSRLRVLTADQIHTERRLRELRDLGYRIDATRIGGDNQYVLRSADPDLEAAVGTQLEHNIRDQYEGLERERLLRRISKWALDERGL